MANLEYIWERSVKVFPILENSVRMVSMVFFLFLNQMKTYQNQKRTVSTAFFVLFHVK